MCKNCQTEIAKHDIKKCTICVFPNPNLKCLCGLNQYVTLTFPTSIKPICLNRVPVHMCIECYKFVFSDDQNMLNVLIREKISLYIHYTIPKGPSAFTPNFSPDFNPLNDPEYMLYHERVRKLRYIHNIDLKDIDPFEEDLLNILENIIATKYEVVEGDPPTLWNRDYSRKI